MKPTRVTTSKGEVRFEIRPTLADGRQMRRRFKTEREAKAELARITHEQNEDTYVHPDKTMTLRVMAERWAAAKATDRKPSTKQHYKDALRPLLTRHGDLPVTDLTDQHVMALRDDMLSGRLRRVGVAGKPLSARSVNAMLAAVSGLLSYGVTLRVLTRNVAEPDLVARVKEHDVEEDAPDRRGGWQNEHLMKFRVGVAGDEWEHGWLLSAIGLRRGEVLGLQWSDIDLERASVTIRRNRTTVAGEEVIGTPKSKRSRRTLPLSARLVEALMNTPRNSEWVVADAAGRRPRPELYSDRFTKLIAEMGLPQIVLHGVRHAVASQMDSEGIPLASIAAWLGQDQKSLATTLGYIHAQDSNTAVIRDLLT